MPRCNRHARLKKWIIDALGDKVLTTIEIQEAISNRSYIMNGHNRKVKSTPTTQRLTQVLRVNKEFVRVNEKKTYPALWRLENV